MSCYQELNAELPMSDKSRADEGSSTNDNELSINELKAVSGAGKEVEAKTTPSPWDVENFRDQMGQAKAMRKIRKKGMAWCENDEKRT